MENKYYEAFIADLKESNIDENTIDKIINIYNKYKTDIGDINDIDNIDDIDDIDNIDNIDNIDDVENLDEIDYIPNVDGNKYSINDYNYRKIIDCFLNVRESQIYTPINNRLQNTALLEYNRRHSNVNSNNVNTNILNTLFGLYGINGSTGLNGSTESNVGNISNTGTISNGLGTFGITPNGMYYLSAQQPLTDNTSYNDIGASLMDTIIGGLFGNLTGLSSIYGTQNNTQLDVPLVLEQSELDKLQKLNYNELTNKIGNIDNDEKCCICLENIKPSNNDDLNTQTYIIVPCNHYFHSNCILEHLSKYHHTCPICRKSCGKYKPILN